MFFILSKVLAFLLNPLCWLIFFLLWALFTKSVSRRKCLLRVILLGSVLLTNPLLIRVAYRCWQINPVEISSMDKIRYDKAIVIGEFGKENVEFEDQFQFSESANQRTD